MEYKDQGEDWRQFNTLAIGPASPNRSVQFNNNGSLGSGNLFYGTNGHFGVGDFSQPEDPTALLHVRGNAGGGDSNAIIRLEDTTHVPKFETLVASGSLGAETTLSAGDVISQIRAFGADSNILSISGVAYREWTRIQSSIKDMTSDSTNEGNLQFSVADNGELEPIMEIHKWGLLIKDQYASPTDNALRLLQPPYAYINFTNADEGTLTRTGTPTYGESGFGFAYRQGGMYYKNENDSDWTSFFSLGGVKDTDQDTYIDPEQSADDDKLRFYSAGSQKMTITPSRS